jgi:hypothetical protein
VTVPESPVSGADLRAGDVVLMTFQDGRPRLLGLAQLTPDLSDDEGAWASWVRDALAGPGAETLVGMNGNALPVTVEAIAGDRVTVSRRAQRDALLHPTRPYRLAI